MTRVRRFDTGTLASPEKLPNGWMRLEGLSARTGILLYQQADGSVRRELVLPEALFEDASLASARMVPVTNTHPAQLLDAVSARAHQVGSVGERLRPEGDYLAAPIMVTDASTVAAIEAGRQELSWGYDCKIDETKIPELVAKWGEYDGIQRERRYNHLAIVDEARAGAGARLRLDSGDAYMVASPQSKAAPAAPAQPERPMPLQIVIAGHRFDLTDANHSSIQQAIDREAADAKTKFDALTSDKTKAERERTDAIGRFDGLRGRVLSFAQGVKARADAMKARMMGCDECGGGGKTTDAEGAEAKCEYCGGTGKVRMHDEIKAAAPADADAPAPVEEMEEVAEDAEQLAAETPEPAEKKDARRADARRTRLDSTRSARERRAASFQRRTDRAARTRIALVLQAKPHLDADVKLDGKSNLDVKKLVLGKLKPALKLDGKDAAFIETAYELAIADAGAAAADQVTPPSVTPPAGNVRRDGLPDPEAAKAARQQRLTDAQKPKAAAK